MPKTNDTRARMIHRMELRMKSEGFPHDNKSRRDKWARMDMDSEDVINKFGTVLLDFVCGYYELPRRKGAAERKSVKLLESIGYIINKPEEAKAQHKIIEYMTIQASPSSLLTGVCRQLALGWEPYGPPLVTHGSHLVLQCMVKRGP